MGPEPGEGVGGRFDAAQPAHQLVEVVDLEDRPPGDGVIGRVGEVLRDQPRGDRFEFAPIHRRPPNDVVGNVRQPDIP